MNKKINIDSLFVVCPVIMNNILIEPFVQYESFGREYHQIIINPRKILVVEEIEGGEKEYYEPYSGEYVRPVNYGKSYETSSTAWGTVYCMNISSPVMRFPGFVPLYKRTIEEFKEDNNMLGYLISFKEYIKNIFGISLKSKSMTIGQAKLLLSLTNLGSAKSFALSNNAEEAEKQINKKVFRKKK